jgi:hypothetical protein
VAAAGPLTNILLALILAATFHLFRLEVAGPFGNYVLLAILFNLILAVVNLIPIPPLDGSKMVYARLKSPGAINTYRNLARYGMFILVAFLLLGGFQAVVLPVAGLFYALLGLPVPALTIKQHGKKGMNETNLLLKAYYEALYDQLEANRDILASKIERLLREEVIKLGFRDFEEEKYAAYRDACLAFVDERIETYNPIGIQYTFDRIRAKQAIELELQLDWYDSREEFEALVEATRSKAEAEMTEKRMRELADELIREVGAFPDKSIISAYKPKPGIGKLPDYVVAQAIEEIIRCLNL